MTLTRLLEIDRKILPEVDEMGLRFAEQLWQQAGCPAEGDALCRALENVLVACAREGVRYPAIVLRRKKELQRGTWKPRQAQPAAVPSATHLAVPQEIRAEGEAGCKLCGGASTITNPGGRSCRLCECYWNKNTVSRKLASGGGGA